MTLHLKLKNSLLANSSYDSSFLDFLQKVVLWEGNRGLCELGVRFCIGLATPRCE